MKRQRADTSGHNKDARCSFSGRLARIKPYKAAAPEQSVAEIRERLSGLGFSLVEEAIHGEGGCYAYCLRLVGDIEDEVVFQTMGKGRTDAYARASAYGEMLERIQNLAFYMMLLYPTRPETAGARHETQFHYYPDERILTGDELRHAMDRLSCRHSTSAERLPAHAAIGVPFRNLFEGRSEYLPFRAFQVIVGSNGMCSGNTPAEAIIHGLCEVFERYVLKQIFLSPTALPEIPLDGFAGHAIHEDLGRLAAESGCRVAVKDCALGCRLPVVGLLIRDGQGERYAFHLGADPSPVTALERCFTEMCQGGPIRFKDAGELAALPGDEGLSAFWQTQLHLNIRCYGGHWPQAVLGGEPDGPFRGFDHPVSASDETDLAYLLRIVKDAGWDLLIRDNGFLGLPSFHVYIPGISEMSNAVSDTFVRHYLAFDRHLHVLTHPAGASAGQRREAVQAMAAYAAAAPSRQFCAAEYFMYCRRHPVAGMSHESLGVFLLQAPSPHRFSDVPSCFRCHGCGWSGRCNYPYLSAVWNRLKETMDTAAWDQHFLEGLIQEIAADIVDGEGKGETG